jgi:ribosomal protein L7/L12
MLSPIIIILSLGAVSLVVLKGFMRSRLERQTRELKRLGIDPCDPAHATLENVKRLAGAGLCLHAIRLHRKITGLGLKASKEAIEAFLKDGELKQEVQPQNLSPIELDSKVCTLLRDGNKIAAIELLRTQTGTSLQEAKERVEALAESLRSF